MPRCTPPLLMVPAPTYSRLEPMAAMRCCTCCCAPWPSATMAITAATPMMMPSIVSVERILLRASARSAIRIVAISSIIHGAASSVFQCRHGLQHLARRLPAYRRITPHLAIAEDDGAPRELRDIVLVSYQ